MIHEITSENRFKKSKLILIVLLSGVLWYVFPRSNDDPQATLAEQVATAVLNSSGISLPSANGGLVSDKSDLSLSELIESNPFMKEVLPELPEGQTSADTTSKTSSLAEDSATIRPQSIPDLRIQAILSQGTESVALIENKIVRVGDQLEGVGTVTEISRDGIRIKASQTSE